MPTSFTVMTWNLENLFPVGTESGPTTPEVYELKLANLAATITQIAPDVLAVQEVGAPSTFADLLERLGAPYTHRWLSGHPDVRGIRVGFISRLPLSSVEEISGFPYGALFYVPDGEGGTMRALGRGAVKVRVTPVEGKTVDLVTAHLKSKLVTYSGGRREPENEDERAYYTGGALLRRTAEAVALRIVLNRLTRGNDRSAILLGDMNDGPVALTTQILAGTEDRSLERPDKGDDVRLYNLADRIPAEHRFSRIYEEQGELIDHILVTRDLALLEPQVDSFVEPIQSITESVSSRRNAVFPDHAPVYARFQLP